MERRQVRLECIRKKKQREDMKRECGIKWVDS